MPTDRIRMAAKQLDTITSQTDIELQALDSAIEEVELLHEEHIEEMKLDEEFLQDLRSLFEEIKVVRNIDQHMKQVVFAYGNGEMSRREFKEAFIEDEERFVEIVDEIRTELEEMIRIVSEEERLTNKDLNIEGETEDMIRELTREEEKLEKTHKNLEDLISEE